MRVTVILTLGMLAPVFRAQCQQSEKVWTDNNEVWMETAEGPRQLTHDGVQKTSVDLAPRGNRIVYIAWDSASDVEQRDLPKEELIEIDVNGLVLRHLTPEGYVHGVTRLEWIDDQRVGAEGSCNGGRDCAYWVLDADSGATLQAFLHGGGFIWSHNRKWIAWREKYRRVASALTSAR